MLLRRFKPWTYLFGILTVLISSTSVFAITEQQKLASPPHVSGIFPNSSDIDGDTLIIGDLTEGDDRFNRTGVAYIYSRISGVWTRTATLEASDGAPRDGFGNAVAIDGNTALVGAYAHGSAGSNLGAVYVFNRINGAWNQTAKLTAAVPRNNSKFGGSVALDGNTALIGSLGSGPGVYVFKRNISNGIWSETALLTRSDSPGTGHFGALVAVHGNTALVSSYSDSEFTGAAYIFTLTDGVWVETKKLRASDQGNSNFGIGVAISEGVVLVGSNDTAYVFTRNMGWSETAKLQPNRPTGRRGFFGVGIEGNTAVVGFSDQNNDAGAAYIFKNTNGLWNDVAELTARGSSHYLGSSVAIDDGTVFLGSFEAGYIYSLDQIDDSGLTEEFINPKHVDQTGYSYQLGHHDNMALLNQSARQFCAEKGYDDASFPLETTSGYGNGHVWYENGVWRNSGGQPMTLITKLECYKGNPPSEVVIEFVNPKNRYQLGHSGDMFILQQSAGQFCIDNGYRYARLPLETTSSYGSGHSWYEYGEWKNSGGHAMTLVTKVACVIGNTHTFSQPRHAAPGGSNLQLGHHNNTNLLKASANKFCTEKGLAGFAPPITTLESYGSGYAWYESGGWKSSGGRAMTLIDNIVCLD